MAKVNNRKNINKGSKENGNDFLKNANKRLIIVILLLLITVASGTFAWFTYASRKSALVLTVGSMNDVRIILKPYQIQGTMEPVNSYTSGVYTQIQAVNNSDNSVIVSLYYKINELHYDLINNGLKYTIVESDSADGDYIELYTGDFTGNIINEEIFNEMMTPNTTKYYRVYLWLDSRVGDQSLVLGKTLDIELNGRVENNGTKPEVNDGMIPVTISNDGTVTTIAENDINWYNYSNKEWANVVLVNSSSRVNYVGTTGKTVEQSDILGYYVWIPRYKYSMSDTVSCQVIGPSTSYMYSGCYSYDVDETVADSLYSLLSELYEVESGCLSYSTDEEILNNGYVECNDTGVRTSLLELIEKYNDGVGTIAYTRTFRPERNVEVTSFGDNGEKTVNIVFENKNENKSSGKAIDNSYVTHPAFTFGDTELNGIWVGKFETSGTQDNPTVLPNQISLTNQYVNEQFATSLKFSGSELKDNGDVFTYGSDYYGLTNETDSHMMKNSEWGAVAYLAQSKYGVNQEIYKNNSSGHYTGRSSGTTPKSGNTTYGTYTWLGQLVSTDGTIGNFAENREVGTKASTTGNVTGVYDMSGGSHDRMMSVVVTGNGTPRTGSTLENNSGFYGLVSNGTYYASGINFPESKYYDSYTTTISTACDGGVCYGHALSETSGWYGDYALFPTNSSTWMIRGDYASTGANAGAFMFSRNAGVGNANNTFRSVLCSADVIDVENDILNGAVPELADGMIPVVISDAGTVTTVSPTFPEWYDYKYREWANMVLVTSSSRENYEGTVGKTVEQSDILAYYVWIPRYKYSFLSSSSSSPQTISIVFENKNVNKSTGNALSGNYRTHPAFTFGDVELNGIWVGKFETSGTQNNPLILPNNISLVNLSVSNQFMSSLKFAGGTLLNGEVSFAGNDYYGLTNKTDSHMMKNSEWAAVAYLSHSAYGINREIFINNSSAYYTGRSGGAVGGGVSSLTYGTYTWLGQTVGTDNSISDASNPRNGTRASSSGNITGIYDMSGGAYDRLMAVTSDDNGKPRSGGSTTANSGFNGTTGSSEYTSGIDFPNSKYYDLYTTTMSTACNGSICYGHALSDTVGWYGDYEMFPTVSSTWMIRGDYAATGDNAGIFSFTRNSGNSRPSSTYRSVLVVLDAET